MTPDWKLPPGVPRGVWDYVASPEIATEYDAYHGDNPLFAFEAQVLREEFSTPGLVADLGQYQLTPKHVAALESCDRRFLVTLQAYELAVRLENQNKPTKPRAKPASKTADSQGVEAPGDS
jgi:hypothetical protein